MIPKIIHYCWFGKKKKPTLVKKCIKSWHQHMPDFEFNEWNESNCDLTSPFLQSCIKNKKWAFISDYIRLKKVYEYGGIYLDTDMLVFKNLDPLLKHDCFFGAEDFNYINASVMGSVKNNMFINKLIDSYKKIEGITSNTDLTEITIPKIITKCLKQEVNLSNVIFDKVENFQEITVYPYKYFYPLPFDKRYEVKNYSQFCYEETYAIHLWNASWIDYSEFHYLRVGEYRKGFLKILSGKNSQKVNLKYLKKIIVSIYKSLK